MDLEFKFYFIRGKNKLATFLSLLDILAHVKVSQFIEKYS